MCVDILQTVAISVCAVYLFVLFIIAVKTKKPFKTLGGGALTGIATLAAVDITSSFTGVFIPLNMWTVSSSAALGIPGVISLLLLNKIML